MFRGRKWGEKIRHNRSRKEGKHQQIKTIPIFMKKGTGTGEALMFVWREKHCYI